MRYLYAILAISIVSQIHAQDRSNPVITSYGGIHPIPSAIENPESDREYKIVIDLAAGSSKAANVSESLNNIARLINLHAEGGVAAENIKVIGVIHAANTKSVLSHSAYKAKYGVNNPNEKLIRELVDSGVELYVCGQSLIARGYREDQVLKEIGLSISALTVLTTYQLKGYAYLKF